MLFRELLTFSRSQPASFRDLRYWGRDGGDVQYHREVKSRFLPTTVFRREDGAVSAGPDAAVPGAGGHFEDCGAR